MSRPHLLELLPADLCRVLADGDVDASLRTAGRVVGHAHHGAPGTRPGHVRKEVLEALARLTEREATLTLLERVTDPADGFVKYLFRSPDGAVSEAVLIPLHKEGRFTVCLSSQVGCAMGCTFCATARLGLTRHLETWEMVDAFRRVRADAPGRVTGAVFMGQGEPLHNYDRVLQAARVLSEPCAGRVARDAITISTVGLVPEIRRYAREGHSYRLIISLTSAVPERRAALMPVTRKYPLPELAAAIREVAAASGGRVTVAWVVIGGLNTGQDEVDALRELLGDVPLRLNLIDVNDARPDGYPRADPAELGAFRDRLRALGVPVVRRYSGGQSRDAACGMLAARRHATKRSSDPLPSPSD